MVSFELGEETEKDVFRLVTSVEASCMNFVMGSIIIESLWLSGRSDRGKVKFSLSLSRNKTKNIHL